METSIYRIWLEIGKTGNSKNIFFDVKADSLKDAKAKALNIASKELNRFIPSFAIYKTEILENYENFWSYNIKIEQ